MQSSIFAAQTGLYLPSIKCHWEIEGAKGPMKTEPIEIQQVKTNSLANHICWIGSIILDHSNKSIQSLTNL